MTSKNDEKCLLCTSTFNLNGSFSKSNLNRLLNSSCSQILQIFTRHLISPGPNDDPYSDFSNICWPFCNQCSPLVMDLTDFQVQIDELQDKVGRIVRKIKSIIISNEPAEAAADSDGNSWIVKLRDDLYREEWCQDKAQHEFMDQQYENQDNYQNSTSVPVSATGKKDRKSTKVKGRNKGLKKNAQVEDEDEEEANQMKKTSKLRAIRLRDRSSLNRKSYEPYYENDCNVKIEENSDDGGGATFDDDFMNYNDEYDSESGSQDLNIKEQPSSIEQNSQRESPAAEFENELEPDPDPDTDEIPDIYLTVQVIRKGRFVKCSKCNFKIEADRFSKFQSHVRSKHEKGEITCPICQKILLSLRSLKRHTQSFHTPDAPPAYLCSLCGKNLSSTVSLRSHMALLHGETNHSFLKCHVCCKPFRDKKKLEPHLLTHMNEEEKALHGATGFMCSLCGKVLPTAESLKAHELVHQNTKSHVCQICGFGFHQKQNLNDHLDTHKTGKEKEQAYSILCNFPGCDKRFRKQHHLTVHMFAHNKDAPKPYKCTELNCEKRFKMKNALTVHLKRHAQIKNHACPECSKPFFTRTHMIRHVNQVHLKSKNVDGGRRNYK